MNRCGIALAAGLAAALLAPPGEAQEIGVRAGATDVIDSSGTSYAWQVEYRQPVAPHLEWTVSWLNEGHPPDHHRDGLAIQAWLGDSLWNDRLVIGLGGGPYRFFDTVLGADGGSRNINAWGALVSLALGWRMSERAMLRFTASRTRARQDIETHTYLVGVGWRLPASAAPVVASRRVRSEQARRTVEREIMAFAGRSIANTLRSESAPAWGLEYRHGILEHVDWTASWVNEGSSGPTEREGLAGQLWAENGFAAERLILGFGGGPYFYSDKERPAVGRDRYGAAALVTLSVGCRFGGRGFARLNWNRIVSSYHRDADVIVLGLGARLSRARPGAR